MSTLYVGNNGQKIVESVFQNIIKKFLSIYNFNLKFGGTSGNVKKGGYIPVRKFRVRDGYHNFSFFLERSILGDRIFLCFVNNRILQEPLGRQVSQTIYESGFSNVLICDRFRIKLGDILFVQNPIRTQLLKTIGTSTNAGDLVGKIVDTITLHGSDCLELEKLSFHWYQETLGQLEAAT